MRLVCYYHQPSECRLFGMMFCSSDVRAEYKLGCNVSTRAITRNRYRHMGDEECAFLREHGVLPDTQPYQTIVEGPAGRAYCEGRFCQTIKQSFQKFQRFQPHLRPHHLPCFTFIAVVICSTAHTPPHLLIRSHFTSYDSYGPPGFSISAHLYLTKRCMCATFVMAATRRILSRETQAQWQRDHHNRRICRSKGSHRRIVCKVGYGLVL